MQADIKKSNDYIVRRATPADAGIVERCIRGLAGFVSKPSDLKVTAEKLAEHMSCNPPLFQAWIAETVGHEPVGFALCHLGYSTWKAALTLYLEDLFVDEAHRKNGAGRALMEVIREEARNIGAVRVVWHALPDNVEAVQFYTNLGASTEPEILMYWSV